MKRTLTVFALCVASFTTTGCSDDPVDRGTPDGSTPRPDGGRSDSGVIVDPQPTVGEPETLRGITDAHNQVRAGASPAPSPALAPLTWDDDLAAVAQAWADRCVFEHDDSDYGENLYANAGGPVTAEDAVGSWAGEAADYDYGANTCRPGRACGHYTQIVWRDSQRVGCGVRTCTTNSPFSGFSTWNNVVCNYDPAGNFRGEKPY